MKWILMKHRIVSCLSNVLGREICPSDDSLNPIEDLEMDSVLIMEFIIQIEDEFQITFSDFSVLADHMSTVGDMIDYLTCVIEEMEKEKDGKETI